MPLVFVLMSRRRKEDYDEVFTAIKSALPCAPDVDTIVVDFEKAVCQSIRDILPGVHIHGCMFHWCKAVYEQFAANRLITACKEKKGVHKILKTLLALPYLPKRHIPEAFEDLRQQTNNCEQLTRVFNYVESTWLRNTVWAVENWSCYRRLVRTNNDVEGWHRRFNYRCGKENVLLYVLLPKMWKESLLVDLQLQLVTEHALTSDKRSSKDKQDLLHKLWEQYEEKVLTTRDFLTKCFKFLPY